MKAALENWLQMSQAAKEFGAQRYPLDVFVVHMLKLSEVLTSRDLTADNLVDRLQEVDRFTKIAMAQAERVTAEGSEDVPKA